MKIWIQEIHARGNNKWVEGTGEWQLPGGNRRREHSSGIDEEWPASEVPASDSGDYSLSKGGLSQQVDHPFAWQELSPGVEGKSFSLSSFRQFSLSSRPISTRGH